MAMGSQWLNYIPQSDSGRIEHLSRSLESAVRDINAIWTRIGPETKAVPPIGDSGGASTNGYAVGTLDGPIGRSDTGIGFTVTDGDSSCTLVGDYKDQIPQYVEIPSGTKLSATKVGAVWTIDPPGWLYTLQGSLASGIAAHAVGAVTTDLGTITLAANNTETDAAIGWCMVTAKPNGSWVLSNFNPDCPA